MENGSRGKQIIRVTEEQSAVLIDALADHAEKAWDLINKIKKLTEIADVVAIKVFIELRMIIDEAEMTHGLLKVIWDTCPNNDEKQEALEGLSKNFVLIAEAKKWLFKTAKANGKKAAKYN